MVIVSLVAPCDGGGESRIGGSVVVFVCNETIKYEEGRKCMLRSAIAFPVSPEKVDEDIGYADSSHSLNHNVDAVVRSHLFQYIQSIVGRHLFPIIEI